MLSVRTVSARSLEYIEADKPEPGIGEVLVQVEHVTLCGTDLHIFEDDYTSELPLCRAMRSRERSLPSVSKPPAPRWGSVSSSIP